MGGSGSTILNGTNPDPILSYIFFLNQLNLMQKIFDVVLFIGISLTVGTVPTVYTVVCY